jgi:hypothetical protein
MKKTQEKLNLDNGQNMKKKGKGQSSQLRFLNETTTPKSN